MHDPSVSARKTMRYRSVLSVLTEYEYPRNFNPAGYAKYQLPLATSPLLTITSFMPG